jgi:hypothetical protein
MKISAFLKILRISVYFAFFYVLRKGQFAVKNVFLRILGKF